MAIAGLVLGLVPAAVIALIMIFGGITALMTPPTSVSSRISDDKPAATVQENGPVVSLGTVDITLADGHCLRLGLALQLAAGQTDDGKTDWSDAYDVAIDHYRAETSAGLATPDARAAAEQEVVARTTTAYPGIVTDVYYTQFVMQ